MNSKINLTSYFISNSIASFTGQLAMTLIAVAITILLTRSISTQSYGYYQLFLSVIGTFSVISLPGIKSTIVAAVANDYDATYQRGIKKRFIYALIGSILFLIYATYNLLFGNTLLAHIGFIAATFFPFLTVADTIISFLQGKEKFYTIALVGIITTSIDLLFLYSAIRLGLTSALPIIIAHSLALSLSFIIFYSYSLRFITTNKIKPNWDIFGIFLSKAKAIELATSKLDYLLVGIFLGASELAVYAVGVKFALKFHNIIRNILMVATPKIAKFNTAKINVYIIAFVSTAIISAAMALLARPVMSFIFPYSYHSGIFLSQIVLFSTPFLVINNLYTKHHTYYLKKKKPILAQAIISPIIITILMIVALPLFKTTGLALVQATRPAIYVVIIYLSTKVIDLSKNRK